MNNNLVKGKFRSIIAIFIAIVISGILTPIPLVFAGDITVTTVAELKSKVEGAVEDTTVILGEDFETTLTDVISLTINHDYNI